MSTVDEDYFFLTKVVKDKKNGRRHLPALKNLIRAFRNKWPNKYTRNVKFLETRIKHI